MRRIVRGRPIVRVQYLDPGSEPNASWAIKNADGYAFVWHDTTKPPLGQYAVTDQDSKRVFVIGYGTEYVGPLRSIKKGLPGNALDVDRARLKEARLALDGKPMGDVALPSADVDAATAGRHGAWWWRTAMTAKELKDADSARFEAVAEAWYAIRDGKSLGADMRRPDALVTGLEAEAGAAPEGDGDEVSWKDAGKGCLMLVVAIAMLVALIRSCGA